MTQMQKIEALEGDIQIHWNTGNKEFPIMSVRVMENVRGGSRFTFVGIVPTEARKLRDALSKFIKAYGGAK